MGDAGPMCRQSLDVPLRRVPLVFGKTIIGMQPIELVEELSGREGAA